MPKKNSVQPSFEAPTVVVTVLSNVGRACTVKFQEALSNRFEATVYVALIQLYRMSFLNTPVTELLKLVYCY